MQKNLDKMYGPCYMGAETSGQSEREQEIKYDGNEIFKGYVWRNQDK